MGLDRYKIVRHLRAADSRVNLIRNAGRVNSVRDFALQHIGILDSREADYVKGCLTSLPSDVPDFLNHPLRRAPSCCNEDHKARDVAAIRSGGRSAYLPKKRLHLKGCNPMPDLEFPLECLPFGATLMQESTIPFGSLSTENVMREILAYCFLKSAHLPVLSTPVCVFEYELPSGEPGCCLVSRRSTNERTEDLLDFHDLTIRDLITVKFLEKRFAVNVLRGDVEYEGIDNDWYAQEKARQLVSMNMNGGFRGILNSNLGNDVLLGPNKLALCDFDTFKLIGIPDYPTGDFLRSFCLWCVVELIKTSPMVWEYIHLDDVSKSKAVRLLTETYVSKSTLYKHYHSRLFAAAGKRGWNLDRLKKAFNGAFATPVCYELLLDVVPNSTVLTESYPPDLSLYIGHN